MIRRLLCKIFLRIAFYLLPSWIRERHIYIFGGSEPVSIKLSSWSNFKIKTVRCNMCGKECFEVDDDWIFGSNKNGWCSKLLKSGDIYECTAGPLLPWCCIYKCPDSLPHPDCVVRYE